MILFHPVWILHLVFSLRMLSIFLVLPVLSIQGILLSGSNKSLIGLAIGIYGLMQALFQIPFGFASDLFGRKFTIIIGLILFLIGSILLSLSNNIFTLIIGRAIQGSGAISSVLIALLSDLVKKKNQNRNMTLIGINFGTMFVISIILSPIITQYIYLHGLFILITILTILNLILVIFFIPTNKNYLINDSNLKFNEIFKYLLTNKKLLKLIFGFFSLHVILMSDFTALPIIMTSYNIFLIEHQKVYLLSILISFLLISLFFFLNRKYFIKKSFTLSIMLLLISQLIFLIYPNNLFYMFLGFLLFFLSFFLIEMLLPSLLSKEVSFNYKGTMLSIYSVSQFIGLAFGSILSGYLLQLEKNEFIFFCNIILSLCWYLMYFKIKKK